MARPARPRTPRPVARRGLAAWLLHAEFPIAAAPSQRPDRGLLSRHLAWIDRQYYSTLLISTPRVERRRPHRQVCKALPWQTSWPGPALSCLATLRGDVRRMHDDVRALDGTRQSAAIASPRQGLGNHFSISFSPFKSFVYAAIASSPEASLLRFDVID
jgi:hypothetical protein